MSTKSHGVVRINLDDDGYLQAVAGPFLGALVHIFGQNLELTTDFSRKSGKLVIQIKDDYYINWKNARIGKILNNFS